MIDILLRCRATIHDKNLLYLDMSVGRDSREFHRGNLIPMEHLLDQSLLRICINRMVDDLERDLVKVKLDQKEIENDKT